MHKLTFTPNEPIPALPGPILSYKKGSPVLAAIVLLAVLAGLLLFESSRQHPTAFVVSKPLVATLLPNKDYFLVHFQKATVLVKGKTTAAYAITYREHQPQGWAIGSMVILRSAVHQGSKLQANQLVITKMTNGKATSLDWNPSHMKRDGNPPPQMVL